MILHQATIVIAICFGSISAISVAASFQPLQILCLVDCILSLVLCKLIVFISDSTSLQNIMYSYLGTAECMPAKLLITLYYSYRVIST